MSLNAYIRGLQANLAWAPPWTISIAVAAVALAFALLFYGVVVRALRRRLRKRDAFWRSLAVRTQSPGRLALIIVALS